MKFVKFLFIFVACGFVGSNAVYWPCQSNDDCTAEKSICSPDTFECVCSRFDEVFSADYTKCLATVQIGDPCEESVQCNLMPTGAQCNSAGLCDCADGYTYLRGRCRPLKNLNETCVTDLDCYFGYDRESVACKDNVCACANGYYHRNGNICRKKSMEIADACVVNADCEGLGSNVQCVSLMCQYVDERAKVDTNANVNVSATTSSTGANQNDKDNNNINTNAKTNGDKLKSESSFTSQLSKTTSKSEESEDKDKDISTLSLVNGRTIDASTITSTNTNTNTGEEEENTATFESRNSKRLREIAIQTSLDAFELRPLAPRLKHVATTTASTSTNTSRRPSRRFSRYRRPSTSVLYRHNIDDDDKTYSTLSNSDEELEVGGRKYGSYCSEAGQPCGTPHTQCTNGVCICKQGFYAKDEKCFAELGEIAESADECEHTFNSVSKKCVCQKNYFYERSLRSCRKPIQYHLSCTSNSQCSPFGASFCHPDVPRRCTCEEYAEYDALLQMCTYKQEMGGECENNAGCPVENSICLDRSCVCQEGFIKQDDKCVRGLGVICDKDDDCVNTENAVCEGSALSNSEDKDKTCQCRKGFVHFKDECVKEAEEIDDECVDAEQCKPLLATCIENKCSCTPEQHFKYGRCENKQGLGSACSRAGQCFTEKDPENVECRNSVCQCKFEYQADNEQKACIRVISNKKNSSGRPSALKIITFILIGSAFLITSAAIKQAYY